MRIENSFELPASRDQAVELLTDVPEIASCVPGVTGVEEIGAGHYRALLALTVGPITTRFEGQVSLDSTQAPEQITAHGAGEDSRSGSSAEVAFTANLTPVGGHRTAVSTVADVTIRGRLGQFGTGVIKSTADEMVKQLVDCLSAKLRGEAPAAATSQARGLSLPKLVLALLRSAAVRGWQRLRRGLSYRPPGRLVSDRFDRP